MRGGFGRAPFCPKTIRTLSLGKEVRSPCTDVAREAAFSKYQFELIKASLTERLVATMALERLVATTALFWYGANGLLSALTHTGSVSTRGTPPARLAFTEMLSALSGNREMRHITGHFHAFNVALSYKRVHDTLDAGYRYTQVGGNHGFVCRRSPNNFFQDSDVKGFAFRS